jgi:hypothetical protein
MRSIGVINRSDLKMLESAEEKRYCPSCGRLFDAKCAVKKDDNEYCPWCNGVLKEDEGPDYLLWFAGFAIAAGFALVFIALLSIFLRGMI